MDTVEHLTEDTFEAAVTRPGLVVIDFWAGWCGPCRAMAPQFERAALLRPQSRFAKVDVDAEPALAAAYGIRSIPTLMVLRDGEPIAQGETHIAAVDAERMLSIVGNDELADIATQVQLRLAAVVDRAANG
jgi:thioredoxin 1